MQGCFRNKIEENMNNLGCRMEVLPLWVNRIPNCKHFPDANIDLGSHPEKKKLESIHQDLVLILRHRAIVKDEKIIIKKT